MRNTYLSFNKAKFNHSFNSLRNSILLLSVGITLSGCVTSKDFTDVMYDENFLNAIVYVIRHSIKETWLEAVISVTILSLVVGFSTKIGHLLGLQFVEGTKITWDYIKSSLSEADDEKK